MKKNYILPVILATAALLVSGCPNVFSDKPNPGGADAGPEAYGTMRVSFAQGAARTAMPIPILSSFDHLEYWFSKDSGAPVQKSPEDSVFILEAGTYDLTVKAYMDSDTGSLAAEGTTESSFSISAGVDAGTITVTLHPFVSGEGTGIFNFGLSYPPGVTVTSYTLTRIAGEEAPYNLMTPLPDITDGDPVILNGGITNVPVGYYFLEVLLRNSAGASTGKSEVVHIYQNLVTRTDISRYTFSADDFSAYLVTTTGDSGPGSLRQALADAPAGKTIQIALEPGSVITLTSALPEITKSLTIEGNGVTLTRSFAGGDNTQLLRITGGTVAISRVHIKDGLSVNYGAAIYSYGSGVDLSLESCIFSGNRATANDGYGGAVSSLNSTLNVKGCTFYNNIAGTTRGYGGAIYRNSGTATLTGNIFYGNTAASGNVVYNNGGTADSGGYNVSDKADGTNASSGSGFTFADSDIQSTGMFLIPQNFKTLADSLAANRLPDPLPANYPAFDFYGQAIAAGGQAGAVQATAAASGLIIDAVVDNSAYGTVSVSVNPDANGFYNNSAFLTASPAAGYALSHWLVNGVNRGNANPLSLTDHAMVRAVFGIPVTSGADNGPGTLRQALDKAQAGDIIFVGHSVSAITLTSALPEITKSLTIEGNSATLTRSFTNGKNTQLLSITDAAIVTIRRVHFKDGRANNYGAAIYNHIFSSLKLESCIFSGNMTIGTIESNGYGGAVYNSGTLNVRGCTFYNNSVYRHSSSTTYGGAIYNGETVTLTGNIFCGNTAVSDNVVYNAYNGTTSSGGYNVSDKADGTNASSGSGFTFTTGDIQSTAPVLTSVNFKPLAGGSAAGRLPSPLPANYPTLDFYGQPINAGGQAGAVQTTASGLIIDVSVNNNTYGTVSSPDSNGLYANPAVLTAIPAGGHFFSHWLVNGVNMGNTNPLNVTDHATVQAVFGILVTSNADSGPGTLRQALTNALAGDLIVVDSSVSAITLTSALPAITKGLTIEGNGVTLTRSFAGGSNTQLLRITSGNVTIRRVHFKEGLANTDGAAIYSSGSSVILNLESCIFSGNKTTASGSYGGAVYNSNGTLNVKGCTFYNNSAGTSGGNGGAIYRNSGTLTLTGNIFYENTAASGNVIYGTVSSGGYNVSDKTDGTNASSGSGFTFAIGDIRSTAPILTPVNFKALAGGSAAGRLPTPLPANYPALDFYGQPINAGGQAGAVQTTVSGLIINVSVNNNTYGTVSSPNADGLYANPAVLTAIPAGGHSFSHWLVDGLNMGDANPLSLTDHAFVQAVFGISVTSNADNGPGTLRQALTNAQSGDVIVVSSSVSAITLTSVLPEITESLTIEGNGVTLTRSFAGGSDTQLLRITRGAVTIRRIHFKNGLANTEGAAIYKGGDLTPWLFLESCVFSGNRTNNDYGGAVYQTNGGLLDVKGCTFYNNSAGTTSGKGGAIYNHGGALVLSGNIFYGNTAASDNVVYIATTESSGGYNISDKASGTDASTGSGFTFTTGDVQITSATFNTTTFKPLSGSLSALQRVPVSHIQAGSFPATDFYGNTRSSYASSGNTAAGACAAP
jgi:hypothetical protein